MIGFSSAIDFFERVEFGDGQPWEFPLAIVLKGQRTSALAANGYGREPAHLLGCDFVSLPGFVATDDELEAEALNLLLAAGQLNGIFTGKTLDDVERQFRRAAARLFSSGVVNRVYYMKVGDIVVWCVNPSDHLVMPVRGEEVGLAVLDTRMVLVGKIG